MTTRPAFDPSVYETPELAEINRPIHPLAWDMIEAERKLTELTKANAPRAQWDAQFDIVAAARAAHAAAVDAADVEIAAYLERREREAEIAAAQPDDSQPTLI